MTMNTVSELFEAIRKRFPDLTIKTDKMYVLHWGEVNLDVPYIWIEMLSNALNDEMADGVPYQSHAAFFDFASDVLSTCSDEVRECIDAVLVENLFSDVPGSEAKSYWQNLPTSLKELYLDFHGRAPAEELALK